MAKLINGTAAAAALTESVAADVRVFERRVGLLPTLAVILVGNDPASEIYVSRKLKACRETGVKSLEYRLPASVTQPELVALILRLNLDPTVNGILLQLPLPAGLDAARLLDLIDPSKDVDGFHPVNVGRLSTGTRGLIPCTPLGCMMLLESVIDNFRGLAAVVIGKSNVVGKPTALLLLERECTVTVTHIHTRGLSDITRGADILVVAAGSPRLVRGDWVKPGAVVVDVGINRVTEASGRGKVVGDCAFEELGHAAAITPVPGGVGPMTVACLLSNTLRAAWNQYESA